MTTGAVTCKVDAADAVPSEFVTWIVQLRAVVPTLIDAVICVALTDAIVDTGVVTPGALAVTDNPERKLLPAITSVCAEADPVIGFGDNAEITGEGCGAGGVELAAPHPTRVRWRRPSPSR